MGDDPSRSRKGKVPVERKAVSDAEEEEEEEPRRDGVQPVAGRSDRRQEYELVEVVDVSADGEATTRQFVKRKAVAVESENGSDEEEESDAGSLHLVGSGGGRRRLATRDCGVETSPGSDPGDPDFTPEKRRISRSRDGRFSSRKCTGGVAKASTSGIRSRVRVRSAPRPRKMARLESAAPAVDPLAGVSLGGGGGGPPGRGPPRGGPPDRGPPKGGPSGNGSPRGGPSGRGSPQGGSPAGGEEPDYLLQGYEIFYGVQGGIVLYSSSDGQAYSNEAGERRLKCLFHKMAYRVVVADYRDGSRCQCRPGQVHNHRMWTCLEVALMRLRVLLLGVERGTLRGEFDDYFDRLVASGYVYEDERASVYNFVVYHLNTPATADLSQGECLFLFRLTFPVFFDFFIIYL